MTGTAIKLIAVISMLIDHIGFIFFPQLKILRIIGRIAFPLYAFFIAEGFCYTKSKPKYLIRLILFALISEIPFDLGFFDSVWMPGYQNVFFTLALGLSAIWIIDEFRKKGTFYAVLGYIAAAVLAFLANKIKTDYEAYGVVLVVLFYSLKEHKVVLSVAFVAAAVLSSLYYFWNPILIFQLLALPLIWLYNGERGADSKLMKYAFYVIYPAHLLILEAIKLLTA